MIRTILFILLASVSVQAQDIHINDKIREALSAQAELDSSYADAEHSPLLPEDLEQFTGHPYFPIDTNWMVMAKVILTPDAEPFEMATTTDRRPMYRQFAWLEFEALDTVVRLAVYQSLRLMNRPDLKDYLFLPFGDATNGGATYGGGRYLDLRIPEGDEIYIDFNQCYNPYCAYGGPYSCPRIPDENLLTIPIKAGIKAPPMHP